MFHRLMSSSHIFCLSCSDTLGLSSSTNGIRVCPACDAQLGNPDDAVVTQLNPSEDYKTSVLSGLSPTIIMECCSKGMSFYQYQVTQEIMYHDYMAKNLTDRYSNLNAQMDSVIKDANSEITALRDKLEGMHMDKRTLEQKNRELIGAFSEKSKAHQRLQKLYQQAKSTQDVRHMQYAAADDTENMIQSMSGAGFTGETYRNPTPNGPRGQEMPQVYSHGRVGSFGKTQGLRSRDSGGKASPHTTGLNTRNQFSSTGQGHLGSSVRPTPNRQPLNELNRSTHSTMHSTMHSSQGFDGYGLGGGVRTGGHIERPAPAMNRNMPHIMRR